MAPFKTIILIFLSKWETRKLFSQAFSAHEKSRLFKSVFLPHMQIVFVYCNLRQFVQIQEYQAYF